MNSITRDYLYLFGYGQYYLGSFVHVWLWIILSGIICTCLVIDSIIRDHLYMFWLWTVLLGGHLYMFGYGQSY